MLLPFLFFIRNRRTYDGRGVSVVVYLGIVTTSVAYILFSAGLKRIPSSSAVTLSLAEPLTAALLSVIVVGERLNGTSWIGITCCLVDTCIDAEWKKGEGLNALIYYGYVKGKG